jgi:coenzyme Q-binding protein COQ10
MPDYRTTRRVAHSAERMFDLVADVERYPEFVPFCEMLQVRGRRTEGEREVLVADMSVGYKLVRETFTSKVTLDRPALQIRADYLDGPFRALENSWTFKPLTEGGSEISFCIIYEFRSRTLALLMGAMFDRIFRTFAGAFEARADAIYGKAATGALGPA